MSYLGAPIGLLIYALVLWKATRARVHADVRHTASRRVRLFAGAFVVNLVLTLPSNALWIVGAYERAKRHWPTLLDVLDLLFALSGAINALSYACLSAAVRRAMWRVMLGD